MAERMLTNFAKGSRVLNAPLNAEEAEEERGNYPKKFSQRKIQQALRNQNKDIAVFFAPLFRNYF